MRKLLLIIAGASLIASCKQGGNEDKKAGAKGAVLPYLQGTWVMTDYINDLKATGSPLQSSGKLTGIVSMTINKDVAENDSLPVPGSLNNHEGTSFNIILQQGANKQQLKTDLADNSTGNYYEIGYDAGKDTSAVLIEYNKDHKEVGKHYFSKVTGPQTDDSEPYGLQYMANKILLTGTYNATDDAGKTSTVEFTEDGLVKGVGGHKTYYIFTDFLGEGDGYKIDELCFDEQTKNQKPYIFQIRKDTVRLYQAKENAERTKLEQGPLKYTLIKK